MKTLLQINTVVNSTSTGRIAEEIGQVAIKSGWESYIAYGREMNRPSKSHKIRIGRDRDVKSHGVQTRLLDNHALGLSSKTSTKKFIKKIKHIKPDIIHIHNLHGYYINIEVLFNYLSMYNTPVIWTFHDCWPYTGHCVYYSEAECYKWETGCFKCPLKKTYPASYLLDRSSKNYRDKKELFNSIDNLHIITVSDWLNDEVKRSFLKNYSIKTINNGINTQMFKPLNRRDAVLEKYNLKDKFILLGVATQWRSRKGLKDYVKLASMLDNSIQIILVGLTKEQIQTLPNNIIGIERTENIEELVELYSSTDIVMNLSVEETFGMTTAEGFACGTPSIVYNATASPELITPETGLIVNKNDINGVLNAIHEIKQNGKSYYSDACRNRALRLYKKEDRYNDYLNLYNELLSNKK